MGEDQAFNGVKKRNLLRLGYDCEVAVGQALNDLMKHGFNVYHDFPADGFNIDHIAVGPTGVFAIETKGRSKHVVAKDRNWVVKFDGSKLIFPEGTDSKSVNQAKSQAKWLSGWLRQAAGETINVEPVLAVPGWYPERIAPSEFKLFGVKKFEILAKGREHLVEEQMRRITYQIDRRCRNVKLSSYKKSD